jgi:prolyl-tRNA synthetase
LTVRVDSNFKERPGFRFNEWELRGVPVRVELGPKDLAQGACVLARRDRPGKEGKVMGVPLANAPARIVAMLKEIQAGLFEKARAFREANTHEVNSYDEFKKKIEEPGGFLLAHWDGTRETEDRIAAETKATIRCIPFNRPKEAGKDMLTGKPSEERVVFAKAY